MHDPHECNLSFMDNRILARKYGGPVPGSCHGVYKSLPAFATRKKALEWDPVSFEELYERGLNLATGLIEMGVDAREHVGLICR
jgi:hypothetical protein